MAAPSVRLALSRQPDTRESEEYEKPLALSPLTATPAAVIRFEIQVAP